MTEIDDTASTHETAAPTTIVHRIPVSVADMLPPKASSLITEAANFMRAHWDEIKQYYASISGEEPSIHGSVTLDEAACVFAIQDIAKANGFAFLGSVKAVQLRRALRYAYKRNTGTPMWQLETQYKRVQIEHKQTAS